VRDARDVACRDVAAARRSEQLSLAEQRASVDRDRFAGGRRADHDAPAARARREERLGDECGNSDDFERDVDTARHDALHSCDDTAVTGVDGMGRAEAPGELELPRIRVDCEDRTRARDARALHDVEPDATAPDHGHRFTGTHVGDVEHRPEAGGDAATGEADHVEWDRAVDHDDLVGSEHRDLGETADADHREERRSVGETHAGAAVRHPAPDRGHSRRPVAQHEPAGAALLALAARSVERQHDVVADDNAVHAGADRFHDARPLVSEHHRERVDDRPPVDHVQVRPADARRGHPDQHFSGPRRVDLDLLEARPVGHVPDHHRLCAHPVPLRLGAGFNLLLETIV